MKFFKKLILGVMVLQLLIVSFPSCHGTNVLFTKVHRWNATISDKWLRSTVHLLLWVVPVYEVSLILDIFLLNLLEFWTGSNPLAMDAGTEERQLVDYKGKQYEITARQNRFDLQEIGSGASPNRLAFVYIPHDQAWYVEQGQNLHKIIEFDPAQREFAWVILPHGEREKVLLP